MNKQASVICSLALCAAIFSGCGNKSGSPITVISRVEGSGTRSAFVELTGVMENDKDLTSASAEISQSTAVVISTVSGNKDAVGYISLGSLSNDVKAVKLDGVAPSTQAVKDGSYKLSRPFNICTKSGLSSTASDFIDFILSDEGQQIIETEGYIRVVSGKTYKPSDASGKISVAGSTSVAPVMDVLADKYMELNGNNVSVEIQQTGSGAGITSTIDGACDIGMSSRELKDEEKAKGLVPTQIAMDGIAVIVNKDNKVDSLSMEQLKNIFTGNTTDWNDVNE